MLFSGPADHRRGVLQDIPHVMAALVMAAGVSLSQHLLLERLLAQQQPHNLSLWDAANETQMALPAPDVSSSPPKAASVHEYARLDALLRLIPDQSKLMDNLLRVATDHGADRELRVDALFALQELLEDLDKARDFQRVEKGFPAIVQLLSSEEARLQEAAAWVVGTAVQNQRDLQLHLLELGALPSLVRLVQEARSSDQVRAKALFAMAALVRSCPEAQWHFNEAGVWRPLLKRVYGGLLQSERVSRR